MGKVIAFASGKGGSGKSVVAANLGIAFAKFGQSTLLIDADLSMPNLAILTGLKSTPVTLYEVLDRTKPVDQAIYKVYGGADIIPCGTSLEAFLKADMRGLKNVVEKVKERYEYVLIDTASGLNKYTLGGIKVADEVVWVVNLDEPSIADTLRLKTASELFKVKTRGVILNRVPSFSWIERKKIPAPKRNELEMRLETKILGVIPESKDVYKATLLQKPVLEYKPRGRIMKAFKECARTLLLENMRT